VGKHVGERNARSRLRFEALGILHQSREDYTGQPWQPITKEFPPGDLVCASKVRVLIVALKGRHQNRESAYEDGHQSGEVYKLRVGWMS